MLSVMIPCQEDDVLLFPTLKSIFSNHFLPQDFEVLLICGDDLLISNRKVNEFPVQIHSGAFKGQAQALNWGLQRTSGDIICTTKPGCIVASDWLKEIDSFFGRHPEVDGSGGPVLPFCGSGTRIQRLASQIFYEEQGFPKSVVNPEPLGLRALFHATNSAFRDEVLRSVRFDESFRYDYDFDACLRMLLKGYCLSFNPGMRVAYIFPASLRSIAARYYYWGLEKVILSRRYSSGTDLVSRLYPFYNAVRSFLRPAPLVYTKKILRLLQHVAYLAGVMDGYSGALRRF
jgi:cellulose synthase/poly-beta-1,6-N-acetylglucosamine synthase-like glycosyltransferase